MCVIPWTVNDKEEIDHFRDVPYITDIYGGSKLIMQQ